VISAPETYGLTPEETLAHRADRDEPAGFASFWAEFREAVASHKPFLRGGPDSEVNRVTFESLRNVRIAGRLTLPDGAPRGAVITSHGYEVDTTDFEDSPEPWSQHGLATLRIRVRGYPPSVEDVPDLRGAWILHNIDSADAWILRGAVADLIQAYRCLRARFGTGFPISIHGESFGGGLAVIASAQLAAMNDPPARLTLALPSFGDWRWRAGRYCNGAGGQVNKVIESKRQDAPRFVEQLRHFDAALHARAITCPILCKLAQMDDVVPAPTAAAVFNGIASHEKWPFIVRYGHYDGGIADLRRHALFERIHPEFLDPARDPRELAMKIPSFPH
jgi:cephalosporin-C deacetylase-like acetyl esterase